MKKCSIFHLSLSILFSVPLEYTFKGKRILSFWIFLLTAKLKKKSSNNSSAVAGSFSSSIISDNVSIPIVSLIVVSDNNVSDNSEDLFVHPTEKNKAEATKPHRRKIKFFIIQ